MHRTLTDALRWHLTYNCYPPVSPVFLDLAEQAVLACADEDYSRLLTAPDGVQYTGPGALTAGTVVQQLRLDDYVAMLAEEEEEAEEPVEDEDEWVWPMPDPPR